MSSLQDTPRSDRIHIVLVGRRNAGKSSLINALTGHRTAIVSDVAGTTTDPVYKSMEIHGLGPCVLVDTAGFDDEGGLGALRLEKTADALDKADIAVLVVTADGAVDDFAFERRWLGERRDRAAPCLVALNKTDLLDSAALGRVTEQVRVALGDFVQVSARTGSGRAAVSRLCCACCRPTRVGTASPAVWRPRATWCFWSCRRTSRPPRGVLSCPKFRPCANCWIKNASS